MQRILTAATILFVALFALASLVGIPFFWGYNLFKFLPAPWVWLPLGFAGFLLVPSISRSLGVSLEAAFAEFPRRSARAYAAAGIASVALILLFIWFRASLPLLGDGVLRTNEILDGAWFYPTEMLDFLLHAALFQFIFAPLGFDVSATYWATAAAAGVVFLFGLLRLARYVYPTQTAGAFLVLASTGLIVLFFGYVESYAIVAALFPYLIHSGLNTLDRGTSRVPFILLFILAAGTHVIAGILFFPVLLLILLTARTGEGTIERAVSPKMLTALIVLTVSGFATGIAGSMLGFDLLDRNILPVVGTAAQSHVIFSPDHLAIIANWLLLSALPALVLAPVLFHALRTQRPSLSPSAALAILLGLSSGLFILIFNPQLGGPRDWDLFSLPAFLLIPSALILARTWLPTLRLHSLFPVSVLGLGLVAAFVGINASTLRTVDRYTEVIQQHNTRSLYLEWANLYHTLYFSPDHLPELQPRRLEFGMKTWQSPPRNRADSLHLAKLLTQDFLQAGDQNRTREFIATLVRLDSTDLENYVLAGRYLDRFGAAGQREQLAADIRGRFERVARGQMEAGLIYLRLGDTLTAGECLTEAYRLDPGDSLVVINYATYELSIGHYAQAETAFARAILILPSSFDAEYGHAVASASAKHPQQAVQHLERARSLARSSDQLSRVTRLLSLLSRG